MIFNWHLFYNYGKHHKISVMMLHHHTHQQESMLQTDFVVASNFMFWQNFLQQQKSKSHRGSASCALEKAGVKIHVIIAKDTKLHYAKCHATLTIILRKLLIAFSLRIKFNHQKLCFIVSFQKLFVHSTHVLKKLFANRCTVCY